MATFSHIFYYFIHIFKFFHSTARCYHYLFNVNLTQRKKKKKYIVPANKCLQKSHIT